MAATCAETPTATATAGPATNERMVERLKRRLRNDRLPGLIGSEVVMVSPCTGWGESRSHSGQSPCAVVVGLVKFCEAVGGAQRRSHAAHRDYCAWRMSPR